MTNHFKGQYRLLAPVDQNTNDFPKKLNGINEEIDIYIPCKSDGQITYYGKSILEFYIPHIKTGNNIIKEIYAKYINPNNIENVVVKLAKGEKISYKIIDDNVFQSDLNSNNCIIFNIKYTDEEVIFQFKYSNSEKIIPILKPNTTCCNRSPFSTKNLPKNDYTIPEDDLIILKTITDRYPDLHIVELGHIAKKYIISLATRNNPKEKIKADMRKKGLSGQKYIHSIGKWNGYLKYVENVLMNKYN